MCLVSVPESHIGSNNDVVKLDKIKNLVNPFYYVAIIIVITSAISLLQFIDISSVDGYYYVSQLLAFGAGIVHVFFMEKLFPQVLSSNLKKGLAITFSIIIITWAIAAIVYFLTGLDYAYLTFIMAFALPYITWLSYHYFLKTV